MKIISSKNKWWINSEKQWAYKDKLGDWWIFNREASTNARKTPSAQEKQLEKSIPLQERDIMGFVYFVVLGVSISVNFYQYMIIKMLSR